MDNEHLVKMANQIATFFRSYPEEEAVAGVQKHITAFWTPRMVDRLSAALPGMGERADILVQRAMRGPEVKAEGPVRPAHSRSAQARRGRQRRGLIQGF